MMPNCPGIIKKTRAVMGCLHRFCRECIDKSMRLGNNECPACRTHCASRRSLRDDSRYDTIIAAVYANITEYEEEELAFHEEEKTRNRQIQASIAQISRQQSEALLVRRNKSKDTPASTTRLSRNCRAYSRRMRNTRGIEPEGYEDNEDENNHNGSKNSSSTDEQATETIQRRCKRRAGAQPSQPSPSAANSDGGGIENDLGASRECKGASSGPVRQPEMLAWGKGGARSKSVRNTRIIKLTKYLENLQENDDKLDVRLMLTSLEKDRIPSLQQIYLCCPPHFSVASLKEYVADETKFQIEDIEILLVKKDLSTHVLLSSLELEPSISGKYGAVLQNLEGQETLAVLRESCNTHLTLAYRLKEGAYRFGIAPETTTTAAQEDTIDSSGISSLQKPLLSGQEDG
ncbi:putative E3 ubiquitin-protein ligase RING1a isoform X2 [Diospyros lotus]|uniref:putative E3 ubiquitin-protein ligase RING1a isoform X2 n=1 Tax=Diospyros lotus TaxID=55363 RepID=UPI00225AF103|nr:putative E3 ubiquitin-protein ligase RING1a isoform X2 [Diospyros lotus]